MTPVAFVSHARALLANAYMCGGRPLSMQERADIQTMSPSELVAEMRARGVWERFKEQNELWEDEGRIRDWDGRLDFLNEESE